MDLDKVKAGFVKKAQANGIEAKEAEEMLKNTSWWYDMSKQKTKSMPMKKKHNPNPFKNSYYDSPDKTI